MSYFRNRVADVRSGVAFTAEHVVVHPEIPRELAAGAVAAEQPTGDRVHHHRHAGENDMVSASVGAAGRHLTTTLPAPTIAAGVRLGWNKAV